MRQALVGRSLRRPNCKSMKRPEVEPVRIPWLLSQRSPPPRCKGLSIRYLVAFVALRLVCARRATFDVHNRTFWLVVDLESQIAGFETDVSVLAVDRPISLIESPDFIKETPTEREMRAGNVVHFSDIVEECIGRVVEELAEVRRPPVREHHTARLLQPTIRKQKLPAGPRSIVMITEHAKK